MRSKLAGIGLALALAIAPITKTSAADLTIFHSWSNESEIKALNVFVDALKAKGNTIKELAVPHEQSGAGGPIVSLVIAGTPPNIFLTGNADVYRDIRDRGLGQTVGEYFDKIGATPNFPAAVQEAIKVDGEVRKIPLGIHIDGMVYYNMKVAKAAGVDPTQWKSADDMFADMDKVKAAGYNFIGVGGNTFQAGYLFHALMAAVAGPEVYKKFYNVSDGGKPDPSVFEEKGLRDAIEMFRKITAQADEGWTNRQWNETTNTVISGKTLMQFHGDWMKGQWKANNKVLGEDFNCINWPGTKAVAVTVDAMGILGGAPVSKDQLAAEFDMASIAVDPVNNGQFAAYKGSTPVRVDAPEDKLDACNKLVLSNLAKDNSSVLNPFYISDSDWINSIWNTMFTFQGDRNMTTDDVIAMLKGEYESIFN
ncbi:ABC-type glycerol-3-phosphate transport system substrate-binding protein [Rhizobium petrolearium]|uniref:ABC transporter substrate-binding protein n=1 Tax=Neorhizobium petrolearium TaxID=515361 RepID=UPI001AEB8018|nr:ABC transporter substrate-binding protein [Neorhizobium petrolearium]MBP1843948.1 ABC-type glycerol-3-phosphate transport system substrate-binding protein [Neorhizobium petrolearium]